MATKTNTPIYLQTLNDQQDNAIVNDDETTLRILDDMHKGMAARWK